MINRYALITIGLFWLNAFLYAQPASLPQDTIESLWQNYEFYKEPTLKTRLFKHGDLLPLMQKHAQSGLLQNEIIGYSVQGRSIHQLTAGKGPVTVLLWSQMHGDEATATMALFDLFNFLGANDQFNAFRSRLLERLTLHVVPMLNPDGAQVWTRRNAMNVDLNRDARNLATPEARLLMSLGKQLAPQFGFNLHDQSTLYAAGKNSPRPATLSFLAPAYNPAKEMNAVRTKAVQIIARMNKTVQTKIPGQIAKYNDTHDSTCFGDTFQEMGISTILIESGGYLQDADKQFIRKINFYGLLTALDAIASANYITEDPATYWALPNNSRSLNDLLIQEVELPGNTPAVVNLGINRNPQVSDDYLHMNYRGVLAKITRPDTAYAYEVLNGRGLSVVIGKTKRITRAKWERLTIEKEWKWLKKGFLYAEEKGKNIAAKPFSGRWLSTRNVKPDAGIKVGSVADFLLYANKKPVYAVINGFLINLTSSLSD